MPEPTELERKVGREVTLCVARMVQRILRSFPKYRPQIVQALVLAAANVLQSGAEAARDAIESDDDAPEPENERPVTYN